MYFGGICDGPTDSGQKARGNLRTEVALGRRCCNGLGECAQAVRARVEQRYKIWAPHVLLPAGSQTLWPLIEAAIDPLWLVRLE